jgi:hypothetical protein
MDLQEFVAQTLIQISEGVAAARAKKGNHVAPKLSTQSEQTGKTVFFTDIGSGVAHLVSFDVAVTVTDKTAAGGKAGIQVMSLLNIQGGKEKSVESSSASRVRFDVPISYDEEE